MVERIAVDAEAGLNQNPTLAEELAKRDNAEAVKTAEAGKILGKFTDQAALESGYSTLEANNTRMAQELALLKAGKTVDPVVDPLAAAVVDPVVDPNDPVAVAAAAAAAAAKAEADTVEEARKAAEGAGLDLDVLRVSYDTNGALSEDEFAALEKGGYPRNLVEDFIAGQEARRDALSASAYAAAGDEAGYGAMTDWARDSLTEAEINLFNTEVNSGDKTRIVFATQNLKARFDKAEGVEPTRQIGGGGPAAGADVFESWAQVTANARNPTYKIDPAFRAAHAAKLGRSKL